jgi:hypothetical protein
MFTTENICKNVLVLIIIFQDLYKHLIFNIKKLFNQLIELEIMIKVYLLLNGIFKMFLNFKKKLNSKSYRNKLKKMLISNSEIIF